MNDGRTDSMLRSASSGQKSWLVEGLAWVALVAGILLNPWLVATFVGIGPGNFDAQLAWLLFLLQIALVGFGVLLLRHVAFRRALEWLGGVLVVSTIAASLGWFPSSEDPAGEGIRTAEQRHDPKLVERKLLDYALTADTERHVQLALETRPVLYETGTTEYHMKREVPAGAVLDLAYGVHPELSDHVHGVMEFHVTIRAESGEPIQWQDQIDLTGDRSGSWQSQALDLSSLAGQTAEISLWHTHEGDATEAEYYDFEATDLAFWTPPSLRGSPKTESRPMPNIVLISVDTLRADHLGFMGYGRDTSPNFDRMADDGVVFRSCFSSSPWTLPAHHSILTGLWPKRHGAVNTGHGQRLLGSLLRPTAAEIFRDAGYATAAFTDGGFMAGRYGFAEGFDLYRQTSASDVVKVVDAARHWVETADGERPFFLFVHAYEPHLPYLDDFFIRAESLEESPEDVQKKARYDGDIRKADQYLGMLLDDLRSLRESRPTWIVLTSDHGEEFEDREGGDTTSCPSDHGHTLYDELLRVPLVFEGFGEDAAVIHEPVRSIDILPTLLDYAGLPGPTEIDGRSLRTLISGGSEPARPLVAEALLYGPARAAVRTPEFKYVRRLFPSKHAEAEPACWKGTPDEELYDLAADPQEHRNLIFDSRRAASSPVRVEAARDLFESLVASRSVPSPLGGAASADPDIQETVDQLRALGYIE